MRFPFNFLRINFLNGKLVLSGSIFVQLFESINQPIRAKPFEYNGNAVAQKNLSRHMIVPFLFQVAIIVAIVSV